MVIALRREEQHAVTIDACVNSHERATFEYQTPGEARPPRIGYTHSDNHTNGSTLSTLKNWLPRRIWILFGHRTHPRRRKSTLLKTRIKRKRRTFVEFVFGTGGVASVFSALFLWYFFLESLDSPGLDWNENVAGVGPIRSAVAWYVTPVVFKTQYGVNVPESVMDGMAHIKQIAPFPTQPNGESLPNILPMTTNNNNNKRRSIISSNINNKLAIAIPFDPSQAAKVLETLEMYRKFPADAEVDIILFCNRDEKSIWPRDTKIVPDLISEMNKLTQEISGAPIKIVYSMLSRKESKGIRGKWFVFFHMLQYLDAAGYSAFMVADTNIWPMRRGWGNALKAHVTDKEDWWVRASTWYNRHSRSNAMDNNMLYRLGDNRMYVFICEAFGMYNDLDMSVPSIGYGEAINRLYLRLMSTFNVAKHLFEKVQDTSVIVNLKGTGCVSEEQVRKKFPFAYMVQTPHRFGAHRYCKRVPAE